LLPRPVNSAPGRRPRRRPASSRRPKKGMAQNAAGGLQDLEQECNRPARQLHNELSTAPVP